MSSLLFVEAFGQLLRDANLEGFASENEEDLYSIFRARAELMSWSTTSARRPLLWGMNDAELTAGTDVSRIGWVQVGLDIGDAKPTVRPLVPFVGVRYMNLGIRRRSVDPALLLPALIQCLYDALSRFGRVKLSAFQVTANHLEPRTRSHVGNLTSMLNWFNISPNENADALIVFDQELLGGHSETDLVASLQRKNTGSFKFGPLVTVPEKHSIKPGFETPLRTLSHAHSGLGVSVTLPEWTASAAGWALATVIDTARTNAPDLVKFAVRIVRV